MKNKTRIQLGINDSSYPAIALKNWNLVFRIGFVLKDKINLSVLQTAVADMRSRFPFFFVNVKRGPFRYFLSYNDNADIVEKENLYCRPFDLKDFSKPNIRVVYNDNLLAVEMFHAVSDGHGTMEFIKCLTARYLELQGAGIPCDKNIIDIKSKPSKEEIEDATQRHRAGNFKTYKLPPAYQYKPLQKSECLTVTSRVFPTEKIKAAAKKCNASITQYLQSALHCALYKSGKNHGKILTGVKVTVSLRKMFPTKTLRNFSLYTTVQCQTDNESTVGSVAKTTQDIFNSGIAKSRMQNFLNATAAIFGSPFWRILPLSIKNIITRKYYAKVQRDYSVTLSNFGIVELNKPMQTKITGCQFIISDMPDKPVTCTAVSVADTLALFISSKDADVGFADCFFELLE